MVLSLVGEARRLLNGIFRVASLALLRRDAVLFVTIPPNCDFLDGLYAARTGLVSKCFLELEFAAMLFGFSRPARLFLLIGLRTFGISASLSFLN